MLALSTAFKNFLYSQQIIKPFIKLYFEKTGIDPDRGLKSYYLFLHELITNFGSISRELALDTGLFRAGSHSFDLSNTKDLGDYLFTLRRKFGLTSWIDKTYHIAWGFKEIPVTTSVIVGIPYLASLGYGAIPSAMRASPTTLGYGDTPSGEETIGSATEEVINIYTGDIYTKNENRTGDKVSVQSKDILKRIADFKLCELMQHEEFYNYSGITVYDKLAVQQVLKYGTHKVNRVTGKSLKDRNNPFSATIGFPNFATATIVGTAVSGDAYELWYFPFKNGIDISYANYTSNNFKMYYWDYRTTGKTWKAFNAAEFNVKIYLYSITNKGIVAYLDAPTISPASFADYIAGTGSWADDNPDPAICMETVDDLTDSNPIRIIYDLLINARYVNFDNTPDLGPIDISSLDFATIDNGYSFDQTYSFFNGEAALINTNITKETSLLKVIQDIAKICGMYFFTSCKKNVAEDRRIRLTYNKSVSPCADKPTSFMRFSTKDVIKSFKVATSSDDIRDKIITVSYDSSYSTPDNFDIRISGTGNRVLSLAAEKNPPVYFYNSGNAAESIALRIFDQLNLPVEKHIIEMNHHGMPLELADYIEIIDHKTGEILITQIFKHAFQLFQARINILGKRYTKMFGPDPENPYKKWAFVDCAYVDNDQVGGAGADASIALGGDTVTLGGGETIDSLKAKIGMDVTINGDDVSDYEHFRLKEIISPTQFKIEESLEGGGDVASKANANKSWSIGNSYHVY